MMGSFSVFLTLALVFGTAGDAHAYLDPGTGNYVLQLLLAAGFAAIFSIKMFFKQIKAALHNFLNRNSGRS